MSQPTYILGFKTEHDLHPDEVGDAVTDEGWATTQDGTTIGSMQDTAEGLLVWSKRRNRTVFVDLPYAADPAPAHHARPFSVWNGVSIAARYRSIADVAAAVKRLVPPGDDWAPEWLVKAGEGGDWQARSLHPTWGDPHPLAVSGPDALAKLVADGKAAGIAVVPYVVIRGRDAWNAAEWAQIAQCCQVAGRCVANLEDGPDYWNGPTTVAGVQAYLDNLHAAGAPADRLELCAIPRNWVINDLGGAAVMQTWLRGVSRASWECYEDFPAPDLAPAVALPRVDAWAPSAEMRYRVPLIMGSMVARYHASPITAAGLEVWHLDDASPVTATVDVAQDTPVVTLSQYDRAQYDSAAEWQTIQKAACSPTSLAMVLTERGVPTNISGALRAIRATGDDVTPALGLLNTHGQAIALRDALIAAGIGAVRRTWDEWTRQDLKDVLNSGRPVILQLHNYLSAGIGHFIVLTGIDADGDVTVADPNGRRTYYSWDQLFAESVDGAAVWPE